MVGFLLILLLIGAYSWYLLFNEQARQRLAQPGWSFYRRSREGKEGDDALNLAYSLIIAVTCSTLLLGLSIIALIRLFK